MNGIMIVSGKKYIIVRGEAKIIARTTSAPYLCVSCMVLWHFKPVAGCDGYNCVTAPQTPARPECCIYEAKIIIILLVFGERLLLYG